MMDKQLSLMSGGSDLLKVSRLLTMVCARQPRLVELLSSARELCGVAHTMNERDKAKLELTPSMWESLWAGVSRLKSAVDDIDIQVVEGDNLQDGELELLALGDVSINPSTLRDDGDVRADFGLKDVDGDPCNAFGTKIVRLNDLP